MSKLDVFKITIDPLYSEDGQDLGIDQIAFTSNPAIKVKGMAFQSHTKPMHFTDGVKMRIAAPALIPMDVYRNDEMGEYFVQFTAEEIENIFVKFMSKLDNSSKFNKEHNQDHTVPAFVLEAWLVGNDTKADRSYSQFGVEVPTGTMFIVAQITDRAYYNQLVEQDQVGFSIEGFLGLKLADIKASNDSKTTLTNMTTKQTKLQESGAALAVGTLTVLATTIEVGAKVLVVDQDLNTVADYTGEVSTGTEVLTLEAGVITTITPIEPTAEEIVEQVIEEVAEVEMQEAAAAEEPTKMSIDQDELWAILQPKLDEIYQMIADLKVEHQEVISAELSEVTEQPNLHRSFSNVMAFLKH